MKPKTPSPAPAARAAPPELAEIERLATDYGRAEYRAGRHTESGSHREQAAQLEAIEARRALLDAIGSLREERDAERNCRLANEAEMRRADSEIGSLRERVGALATLAAAVLARIDACEPLKLLGADHLTVAALRAALRAESDGPATPIPTTPPLPPEPFDPVCVNPRHTHRTWDASRACARAEAKPPAPERESHISHFPPDPACSRTDHHPFSECELLHPELRAEAKPPAATRRCEVRQAGVDGKSWACGAPMKDGTCAYHGAPAAPCGGSRCWQTPDGSGWVHSSKSYDSCSVNRSGVAAPAPADPATPHNSSNEE